MVKYCLVHQGRRAIIQLVEDVKALVRQEVIEQIILTRGTAEHSADRFSGSTSTPTHGH